MATSGKYTYNATASQIINEALALIESYDAGESLTPEDEATCLQTLEMMIKNLQAKHIGLWKNTEITLIQSDGGYKYDVGLSGDHVTTNLVKTEVATAGSSGDATLEIDSITGMSDNYDRNGISAASTPAGSGSLTLGGALSDGTTATLTSPRKLLIYSDADDSGVAFGVTGQDIYGVGLTETITGPNTTTVYSVNEYSTVTDVTIDGAGTGNIEVGQVGDFVGIELEDGTLQWTNIGGALATTLPLVATLTDDVTVDSHVYVYTSKVPRPLEIVEARVRRENDTETPLIIMSRQEYLRLPNKDHTGIANQVYYDPQRTDGVMYVWTAADSVKDLIVFTGRIPLEDVVNAANNIDFPQEWILPLAWNLAPLIAPKFGKAFAIDNQTRALMMLEEVSGFDREYAPVYFGVRAYGERNGV